MLKHDAGRMRDDATFDEYPNPRRPDWPQADYIVGNPPFIGGKDVRARLGAPGEDSELYRPMVRRLGKDGWLGLGWPTEYGGQGRPATDQYVMFDEVQRAGVPFPFVTVTTIGPALMRYGSPEQKAALLKRQRTPASNERATVASVLPVGSRASI